MFYNPNPKKIFTTLLLLISLSHSVLAGIKIIKPPLSGKLYVLCIGIDHYQNQSDYLIWSNSKFLDPLPNLAGCASDARLIHQKLIRDFTALNKNALADKSLIPILLTESNATKDSIKKVFDFIARESKPEDGFILFYAGITRENRNKETFLLPWLTHKTDSLFENPDLIPLTLIARWMNSIQAQYQLVISEAGMGEPFSLNLIDNLFESDAFLASQELRNRIIITTKSFGMDSHHCGEIDGRGGPLAYYLNQSASVLEVFVNPALYEFKLHQIEYACDTVARRFPYATVIQEKDYTRFLTKRSFRNRGSGYLNKRDTVIRKSPVVHNYALVIATNQYKAKPYWENLENPLNDAKVISGLLAEKFGFEIKTLYDAPKDTIVKEIIRYNSLLAENDNFLLFVAGHGYYDTGWSDGFIVFKESRLPELDPSRESYLPMASLNRLLDNLPAKRVFAMFDICFGAYFDINTRDLSLSDYKKTPADTLLNRKNKYTSRIFLASGKGSVPDFWSNNYRHSPFADKLIQQMKLEADYITPGKLFTAAEQGVTEPVLKEFGKHAPRGDIILKVVNK